MPLAPSRRRSIRSKKLSDCIRARRPTVPRRPATQRFCGCATPWSAGDECPGGAGLETLPSGARVTLFGGAWTSNTHVATRHGTDRRCWRLVRDSLVKRVSDENQSNGIRGGPHWREPPVIVPVPSSLWVVGHELRRSTRRCATVREMKEDPSGSVIRSRSQATASCCGQCPSSVRRATDRTEPWCRE